MASYKTPDVYVEEISKLPASVAQVETAIPAFIGYTESHTSRGKSYENKPTKIDSMVEFEALFGGAPPIEPTVTLNNITNAVEEVDLGSNSYYLYDSMRLFFDNGGGKCYIVSVGTYSNSVAIADILAGLKALEKEDEPTILLSPDAASLSADDLASFQQQALKQSATLMDRIAVMDLRNSGDHDQDVQDFRDKVGINHLKYGAAYTPWVNTAYPKQVPYRQLTLKKGSTTMRFRSVTKDSAIRDYIDSLVQPSIDAVDGIGSDIKGAAFLGGDSIQEKFVELFEEVEAKSQAYDSNSAPTLVALKKAVSDLLIFNHNLTKAISDYHDGLPDPGADPKVTKYAFKLKPELPIFGSDNNIDTLGQTNHQDVIKALTPNDAWATTDFTASTTGFAALINDLYAGTPITNAASPLKASYKALVTANKNDELANIVAASAAAYFGALTSWIAEIEAAAATYETTFDSTLSEISGTYKSILAEVGNALNDCPPSGAIAGVMATVDETRGVWKAPANVSLNSVISPIVSINNKDQEDLNVDVNAGKSINAIRAFTGKGTLVWGARTLAGNDNEWRYVSVRRFYNMVEESVKKATYWAVFEPNDANTWIRVQGMIENFLTDQWRQGALAGATPQDAFFVNVGLGTTMTSVDILEGRMNVEIGMAAVRPAEFIILKFSHKLQES